MEPRTVPYELEIAQAVGQALGTVAVVIALVTLMWQWRQARKDREDRKAHAIDDQNRHNAQIAAQRQAENERLATQARRVVPAKFPGTVFSPRLWNIRIDNRSNDVVSEMTIDITIEDADGTIVSDGYKIADRQAIGQAMTDVILPEYSRTLDTLSERHARFVDEIKTKGLTLAENTQQFEELKQQYESETPAMEMTPEIQQMLQVKINSAIQTQLTDEWPTVLAPWSFTAMAIETTHTEYTPFVRIQFEDSAGYIWERTDITGPLRITGSQIEQ